MPTPCTSANYLSVCPSIRPGPFCFVPLAESLQLGPPRQRQRNFVLAQQEHLVQALQFELGKVENLPIRERMVGMLSQIDKGLAGRVAEGLGMPV